MVAWNIIYISVLYHFIYIYNTIPLYIICRCVYNIAKPHVCWNRIDLQLWNIKLMTCHPFKSFSGTISTFMCFYITLFRKRTLVFGYWSVHSRFPDSVSFIGHAIFGVYGPLAGYVKLRVPRAPGMSWTFSPPPRVRGPDMHQGTCVTHVPWCMPGLLNRGLLWSRWRGKRSRHAQLAILCIW